VPFFRRSKPDVPVDALGRPWRSAVPSGLRTGLFDEPEGPADDDAAEEVALPAELDPDIASDLDDFADAVETLRPGDMGRLVAFWGNIDEDDRRSAYDRAQEAAETTGRREVIRLFQEELRTWSQAHSTLGPVAPERMLIPTDDPLSLASGRYAVRPVLVDTMVALALQDELDDADFETLFGPWRDAMGDGDGDADAADGRDGRARPTDPSPAD
jgi:hypothetical protein